MTLSKFMIHRERIRAFLLGKKYYKAVEALEFASEYHTGIRKDGVTPEFHHQISIAHFARTLSNLRYEEEVLCASFMHDTMEDYNIPIDVIRSRFGIEIANAVMLLTKKYMGVHKDTAQYYRDLADSPIASIVKGCDRIHNFQTMPNVFSSEKQEAYIVECETHILPMLDRARNLYPDQELAYENIKYALKSQIDLIRLIVEARQNQPA